MPPNRKYLNAKHPEDFDNSEYEAEHITPRYTDKNGIPYPFKIIWFGSVILLLLIGLWMIYTNQSSQGFHSGGRYGSANGKPNSINGYGVLWLALLMGLISIAVFWPGKKKKHKA